MGGKRAACGGGRGPGDRAGMREGRTACDFISEFTFVSWRLFPIDVETPVQVLLFTLMPIKLIHARFSLYSRYSIFEFIVSFLSCFHSEQNPYSVRLLLEVVSSICFSRVSFLLFGNIVLQCFCVHY